MSRIFLRYFLIDITKLKLLPIMKRFIVTLSSVCLCAVSAIAQDRITLKNGDNLVGDIKSMKHTVLTVETDYSEDDFTIDWKEVQDLTSSIHTLLVWRMVVRLMAPLPW